MASIRHVGSKALGLPLLAPGSSNANTPPRFYEQFGNNGHILDSSWPRMTTEESERPDDDAAVVLKSRGRGATFTRKRLWLDAEPAATDEDDDDDRSTE